MLEKTNSEESGDEDEGHGHGHQNLSDTEHEDSDNDQPDQGHHDEDREQLERDESARRVAMLSHIGTWAHQVFDTEHFLDIYERLKGYTQPIEGGHPVVKDLINFVRTKCKINHQVDWAAKTIQSSAAHVLQLLKDEVGPVQFSSDW